MQNNKSARRAAQRVRALIPCTRAVRVQRSNVIIIKHIVDMKVRTRARAGNSFASPRYASRCCRRHRSMPIGTGGIKREQHVSFCDRC